MNTEHLEPFWSGYKQKYQLMDYCELLCIRFRDTVNATFFFDLAHKEDVHAVLSTVAHHKIVNLK